MADETSICNSAAVLLGSKPIVSIDDENSTFAKLCKATYPQVRDFVLDLHPWNCATRRVILSNLVATPEFNYAYKFQLPSDVIRVVSANDDDDYKLEDSRTLLCDSNEVHLIYIYRLEDPNEMPATLREVIATRLAWQLSFAITQTNTDRQELMQVFQDVLRKAKTVDAQSDGRTFLSRKHYINSRSGDMYYPNRR